MRPLTFVLLSCLAQGALAATAIIRDGSVGPGADLQPQALGNVTEIDESMGLRPGNGVNLLHSFLRFDVGAGDVALFTANPDLITARIISRVTGADASQIFGTIASDVAGADLFLLNPRGIVFGPDAAVDTQGSFYASTAATLAMLEDDAAGALTFSDDVRLAFAEPTAFGFLDAPAWRTRSS